jgi:hypothetical protein
MVGRAVYCSLCVMGSHGYAIAIVILQRDRCSQISAIHVLFIGAAPDDLYLRERNGLYEPTSSCADSMHIHSRLSFQPLHMMCPIKHWSRLVPCIVYKLCISSPPKHFGPMTIFHATFLCMPILLRIAHVDGI